MDMVCLEPCKIQKRQTISWANCKIGLILNIWHMGKFSIHSLEGLPFTISALWPELGMGAALRGGTVGTSLAPAGSYSALWFLGVIFSKQGPNFLHTLCGEPRCLPSFHEFHESNSYLSSPPSEDSPFWPLHPSLLLSDLDFVTLSTGTAMV